MTYSAYMQESTRERGRGLLIGILQDVLLAGVGILVDVLLVYVSEETRLSRLDRPRT